MKQREQSSRVGQLLRVVIQRKLKFSSFIIYKEQEKKL